MNKKIITQSAKVALAAGALATVLTGCCLWGSKDCCDRKACCAKPACCCGKADCRCQGSDCRGKPGDCRKTSGVNTSMTLGIGTDGIKVGSDSNLGSHNASMHANADAGLHGIDAGVGGGVN